MPCNSPDCKESLINLLNTKVPKKMVLILFCAIGIPLVGIGLTAWSSSKSMSQIYSTKVECSVTDGKVDLNKAELRNIRIIQQRIEKSQEKIVKKQEITRDELHGIKNEIIRQIWLWKKEVGPEEK